VERQTTKDQIGAREGRPEGGFRSEGVALLFNKDDVGFRSVLKGVRRGGGGGKAKFKTRHAKHDVWGRRIGTQIVWPSLVIGLCRFAGCVGSGQHEDNDNEGLGGMAFSSFMHLLLC
jgi:hypothetical protein